MLEEMIYNKIRFKNDKVCVIKLLKVIKINDVEKIGRVLKSKSSLLIINSDNDSRINYFEIKMKLT